MCFMSDFNIIQGLFIHEQAAQELGFRVWGASQQSVRELEP